MPQRVTVYGAEDADAVDDTATAGHSVSGGDYGANGVTAADVDVIVTDNELPSTGILLTIEPLRVPEGVGSRGRAIVVAATLSGASRNADTVVDFTVAGVSASEAIDFAPVPGFTLTIPAGSTGSTATFVLVPVDDVDEDDETLNINASTASGLTLTPASRVLTIVDDDSRGVVVAPTSLTFPEGESGTYTVVLTPEPTDTVMVSVTLSGDEDVTTPTAELTFAPRGWNVRQRVAVSGARDEDEQDDQALAEHVPSGGD